MNRLVSRNKFIPGGFKFHQAETNWSAPAWASFSTIVDALIQHRRGNPYLVQKNNWAVNPDEVGLDVEAYNVKICESMGYSDYITDGAAAVFTAPKSTAPRSLSRSVAAVAGGVKTLTEWEIAGGNLVPQELAESRALTCSTCPQNVKADLTSWFTTPAAELIKRQLEARNNLKIQTASDDLLGVCDACACPLKLKVHTPLDIITKHMPKGAKEALDPSCWVLHEH